MKPLRGFAWGNDFLIKIKNLWLHFFMKSYFVYKLFYSKMIDLVEGRIIVG